MALWQVDLVMTHAQAETTLTWRAHPAAQHPAAAIGAAAIVLLIGVATWLSFGLVWGVGAVVVLLASLNRFYLPSRFTIDEHSITARYPFRTQRMNWRDVRRFLTDSRGGYLSTRAHLSRMDAFMGMHLLFGSDREAIIAAIRHRTTPTAAASAVVSPEPTPALPETAKLAGGRA